MAEQEKARLAALERLESDMRANFQKQQDASVKELEVLLFMFLIVFNEVGKMCLRFVILLSEPSKPASIHFHLHFNPATTKPRLLGSVRSRPRMR